MIDNLNIKKLAQVIDYTILKPNVTIEEIKKACNEAKKYEFACIVVAPYHVPVAVKCLHGSNVKVCTVIGFPLGSTLPDVKSYEARRVVKLGVKEIDMVMNISAMKSCNYDQVYLDIKKVVDSVKKLNEDIIVKVIIETCYLTDEEKLKACEIIKNAGADFVKTSTGFGLSGASIRDVLLIKAAVGDSLKVKAAGGIRTLKDVIALINAGADRIGSSAATLIMKEATYK